VDPQVRGAALPVPPPAVGATFVPVGGSLNDALQYQRGTRVDGIAVDPLSGAATR
jgi:hypothetical protein